MTLRTEVFSARLGDVRQRLDPSFARASTVFRERYDDVRFPLVSLGAIATRIQYGTSKRAHAEPSGVPVLRMSNLQEDGFDLSDLKYVHLPPDDIETFRLRPGDILFNRTNSKELVGKCAVFNLPGDYVFASYLLRIVVDMQVADPVFVATFLNTPAGRLQIDRVSRQIIGMANVNTKEVRAFQVPLPPLDVQRGIVEDVQTAAEEVTELRRLAVHQEAQSERLVDELVTPEDEDVPSEPPKVFSIRLAEARGRRLDAVSYRTPTALSDSEVEMVAVGDIAEVGRRRTEVEPGENGEVPYVGLPECDRTRVRVVARRPLQLIGGRRTARPGDVLFARIEPSIFNKKYVWITEGVGEVFTSSEFHVVTALSERVYGPYLYACLLSASAEAQVRGRTTGSSGRRRLHADLLRTVRVPLPSTAEQRRLGDEVLRLQDEADANRRHAAAVWREAKCQFEAALFGGET